MEAQDLNLIRKQQDIDKIYLHAKDLCEAKYQHLIKIREKVGIDHDNDPRAYIEYSMICVMFAKILIITIPIKKIKY